MAGVTVAELRALVAETTPGPWTVSHRHVDCTEYDDERSGLGLEIEGPDRPILRGDFARSADARLVALAPLMARLLITGLDPDGEPPPDLDDVNTEAVNQ